ncbi:adenylate/guanylate cyclase domain-containing protein [Actinoallomurus sp. NPDC052274]|uniref:adenylate/guanylate cyclase domain-containing protein n=1 Tax=Actinoallomurus sp. NPDC052274 TaxID=3155420 RepID=UPI003424D5C9
MAARAVTKKGLHGRLDGPPGASRAMLERRARWLLMVAVGGANLAGALFVLLFSTFVMPDPPGIADPAHVRLVNLLVFCAYLLFGAPIGVTWGMWLFRPVRTFARHEHDPTEEERRGVLRGPLRLMAMQGTLWGLGAVGWAVIDAPYSDLLALKVGMITVLGGVTTCAIVYLLTERLLRPIAAVVMAAGPAQYDAWFGITPRTMLAWALGSGVPVLGLVAAAVAALVVDGMSLTQLAVTILVLGGVALLVGFQVTYFAARAIADPVRSVREGLARIERGDLRASVPVYDASELGRLQAGFNHMAAGLRENERLRDLFGRHVGEDVARHALEHGVVLGGETCDAAVFFVDLQGSTHLAATRPPGEVVALLNAYFGVVVEVVAGHGGLINKFQGDAALAVFGAPERLEDPAGQALAAARELSWRLREELPQLVAGIGVSAGQVVAGHIGAEQRLEYTVVGDPVNEAARLSDLAKTAAPDRLLASAAVVAAADQSEAAHWRLGSAVTLRGRTSRTRLAAPFRRPPPSGLDRVINRLRR